MPAPIYFFAIGAVILFVASVWGILWFLRRVVSRWIDRGWMRPTHVTGVFFLLTGGVLLSSAFILPNALLVLAVAYGLLGAFCLASGLERFLSPPAVESRPIWYEGTADLSQAARNTRRFSMLWLTLFVGAVALSIVCLTAARQRRSDRDLAHEQAIARIEELGGRYQQGDVFLVNTSVSDDDLRLLADLKHVRGVYLGKTRISNDGMRHLAEIDEYVTTISLSGTPVGDAGLHHLKQLHHLQHVSLRATRVTGTGITFATLPSSTLNYLDVSRCPLTKEGLEQLARVRCRHLSLSETNIDDDLFPQLDALSVEHLNISNTELSADVAARLGTPTRRILHASR